MKLHKIEKPKGFGQFVLFLCELSIGIALIIRPLEYTDYIFYTAAAAAVVFGLYEIFQYLRLAPSLGQKYQKLSKGLMIILSAAVVVWKIRIISDKPGLLAELYGMILLYSTAYKLQVVFDIIRMKRKNFFLALTGMFLTAASAVLCIWNPFEGPNMCFFLLGILLILEAVLDLLVFVIDEKKVYEHVFAKKKEAADANGAPVSGAVKKSWKERRAEQKEQKDLQKREKAAGLDKLKAQTAEAGQTNADSDQPDMPKTNDSGSKNESSDTIGTKQPDSENDKESTAAEYSETETDEGSTEMDSLKAEAAKESTGMKYPKAEAVKESTEMASPKTETVKENPTETHLYEVNEEEPQKSETDL